MKNIYVKHLMIGALCLIVFIACKKDNAISISPETSNESIAIAELIDRSEKIQLGKEWDFVQNFYMDQKNAITKDPKDYRARIDLAELFVKEARITGEHGHYYPAALLLMNEVIASETEDKDLQFRALVTKAGVQLSLHEFNDALETAKKAIVLNPQNAQIYGVLVDCHVELGQYNKAVEMADKMINIKPDIRSYSRISYLREIHGDVEGAKEALSLAVKSGYPGYEETAWAMITLGDLYKQYGEFDNAKKIYKQILEMRKDYPFAVGALGQIAYEQGDMAEAEKLQKEAMSIIPEVGFYVDLAYIYKKTDRKSEMNSIIKEIFPMLEDDVQSGHNMNLEYADIYLNLLNQTEKALEYALLEYQKRPQNIDVNRVLSLIYLKVDDNQKAKTHYEKAKITDSKHPDLKTIKRRLS